jgi:hypothetical protein
MNGKKVGCMHNRSQMFILKKEGNCDRVGEPGGYYAK